MTESEINAMMQNAPLQFVREKDELTKLQERWTGLIRHMGNKMVDAAEGKPIIRPDLYDLANEIDAFFTSLKIKKQ